MYPKNDAICIWPAIDDDFKNGDKISFLFVSEHEHGSSIISSIEYGSFGLLVTMTYILSNEILSGFI